MNNEDFERQMRFILEQQARFAENLAKQQQREARNLAKQQEQEAQNLAKQRQRDAQVNALLDRVDRQIAELAGYAGPLRDALVGLTYHVERHDQQIAANEKAIAELVAQGKETDARLNALIMIVERHISGHQ